MHRLLEESARVFEITLRPEEGQKLVPAQPARMSGAEQREQRKTMSLDGRTGNVTIVVEEAGTAEEAQ